MIKKSFRRLAHLYHPDKNDAVPNYSDTRYRDIQEAYKVLSDETARMEYDNERWLSGKYNNARQQAITPEFLLREVRKLRSHLSGTGRYRINEALLTEYLEYLLQDSHIDILNVTGDNNTSVIMVILECIAHLSYSYSKEIYGRLKLVNTSERSIIAIENAERQARYRYRLQRAQPWLIIFITILVLTAMYFYSIKKY